MKKQRVECQHEGERIQEYNLCFTTVERKPTKTFDGAPAKKGGK